MKHDTNVNKTNSLLKLRLIVDLKYTASLWMYSNCHNNMYPVPPSISPSLHLVWRLTRAYLHAKHRYLDTVHPTLQYFKLPREKEPLGAGGRVEVRLLVEFLVPSSKFCSEIAISRSVYVTPPTVLTVMPLGVLLFGVRATKINRNSHEPRIT